MYEDEVEPDEVQEQIGRSLKSLGFRVRYIKPSKLDELECFVVYGANFKLVVDTTESYILNIPLTIGWHERKGKNIPRRLKEIVGTVEYEYVVSGLTACTSFIFGEIVINDLGTSYSVEIPIWLREEVDHG
jgi:hypothetical protein